jgi:predicted secreted protein
MSLSLSIATYFIIWWLTLFMVLPFGVKTQEEDGNVVPGSVESAPAVPHIFKKALITTILAAIIFAIVYSVYTYNLISMDDIPYLPKFD